MKEYSDFQWGRGRRGYCGGHWGGGDGKGGQLKMQCCIPDLNLEPEFKYITLLCCKLRELLNIYRPTI